MSTEEKQDTITVELPIEADGDWVHVAGVSADRNRWREVATGLTGASVGAKALAPAVVAWMDRDEWEPLPIPEVGRRIQATLRDGRVETFKVGKVKDGSSWARIWKADSDDGGRFLQRTFDVDDPGPADVVAWEYVDDEPETVTIPVTLDIPKFLDLMQATIDVYREALK